MVAVDDSHPVLVGVGTREQLAGGTDTLGLLVEAARAALDDTGAPGLVRHVGLVAVTAGTTPLDDPAGALARSLGVGARTVLVRPGVPQTTPVLHALTEIRAGRLEAALIGGSEARRRAAVRRRSGRDPHETPAPGRPDEIWEPDGEMVTRPEIEAGLIVPARQYALIENARRAERGWSIERHLDDIADLWAGFAEVAATNPRAAFPARTRHELRHGGPDDRPLAFPYRRWHATQWTVDQAGVLVVCSAGLARRCGIGPDRWVFPEVVVESRHAVATVRRRDLARWPAMEVLGEAAAGRLGAPLAEAVGPVELYSCFPVAVRIQAAELGLVAADEPVERPLTVTGGMTFAGGPFNNFVYQAIAAMVRRLRGTGGGGPRSRGLVTAVSGFLHEPGLTVWSAEPPAGVLLADLSDRAAAVTPTVGIAEPPGPDEPVVAARVISYTVLPESDHDPARVVVVADTDAGRRLLVARSSALAERVSREEFIGAEVGAMPDGGLVV